MPTQASKTSAAVYQGLADKIATIQNFYTASLSHADVRALAESLAMNAGGALDIKGFFSKLKSLLRYIPDPTGTELIKAPWVMVDQMHETGSASGDCDDFASLAYTLLHSVGVPAELYVGWYAKSTEPSHIFVGVPQKSGGYVAFDLVANVYGQTIPGLTGVQAYA